MAAGSSTGGRVSSTGTAAGKFDNPKYANYNVDLPDAEWGKVVTRFPPEPSGYMHIGHAKAAILNEVIARKYGGKMILRFDDTNPDRESEEFETTIREDVKRLGIEPDMYTWTSDHFPMLLEKGEWMVKNGKAYVDTTDAEVVSAERMDGIDSKCRNQTVEENLRLWKEMCKGSDEGLTCVVRAKIDMQNPNKCLRDPMIFRCKAGARHHRLGDKYDKCIFPGYDFACPIVDSVEGVTHAMRTLEYKDREAQYQWMCKALGIRCPHIYEFSRLNFTHTCLSKRKLTQFVAKGITNSWSDPRMPTVRGILRKGMTVKGLREYIYQQGASRNDSMQAWDKIWALNKQEIDPIVPRYVAIDNNCCQVTCDSGDGIPSGIELRLRAKHPKDAALDMERCTTLKQAGLPVEGLGSKVVRFSKTMLLECFDADSFAEGEEITLMDWGNAFVKKVTRDASGKTTAVSVELNLKGDFKKTKKKVTWLAALNDLVPLKLVELKHLLSVPKIEEGMDPLDLVTPDSWVETDALGDQNLRLVKEGEIIQLSRKGFYICEKPYINAANPMMLIAIPDGRVAKAKKAGGAKA